MQHEPERRLTADSWDCHTGLMWHDYDRLKASSKVAVLSLVQYCPLPVVVHNCPSGDSTPSPEGIIRADTWVCPYNLHVTHLFPLFIKGPRYLPFGLLERSGEATLPLHHKIVPVGWDMPRLVMTSQIG